MKSPDNVRQLIVIVGIVKEIEGAQSENTKQNENIEDNGSDTTEDEDSDKSDEKKIEDIVNEKDTRILSIKHDEVKVVDEEMDKNYVMMINKTQMNNNDESDVTIVKGKIYEEEMKEIDEKNNKMMKKTQNNNYLLGV